MTYAGPNSHIVELMTGEAQDGEVDFVRDHSLDGILLGPEIEIRQLSRTTPTWQGASKIVSLQRPGESVYGQGQGWSEKFVTEAVRH